MGPGAFSQGAPMQKPFDISTLLESDPNAEATPDAYAPPRTRTSDISPQRGDDNRIDRRSFAPGPKEPVSDVHESGTSSPAPSEDAINPSHYRKHPSGIECIEVTRHMNFNVGNAIKYIWRHLDKGDPIENLQKAQWYIDDEIRRLQGMR